ncbi:MAG TPA: hypothetical protein VFH39_03755 [Candidatus Saccharimonadales bacterium]|nr:hypothetical protein [Candidatus Saccharimonadales bacterium]
MTAGISPEIPADISAVDRTERARQLASSLRIAELETAAGTPVVDYVADLLELSPLDLQLYHAWLFQDGVITYHRGHFRVNETISRADIEQQFPAYPGVKLLLENAMANNAPLAEQAATLLRGGYAVHRAPADTELPAST